MWPKFCVALVTRYDLLSSQNLEPLSYAFSFGYIRHYTSATLSLCCDNIKDWCMGDFWLDLNSEILIQYFCKCFA